MSDRGGARVLAYFRKSRFVFGVSSAGFRCRKNDSGLRVERARGGACLGREAHPNGILIRERRPRLFEPHRGCHDRMVLARGLVSSRCDLFENVGILGVKW